MGLMSATSENPILACVQDTLKTRDILLPNIRTRKSFFIYTSKNIRSTGYEDISDQTVVFGTYFGHKDNESTTIKEVKPTVKALDFTMQGTNPCFVVHPNYCQGWNPEHQLKMGYLDFRRYMYEMTTNAGIVVLSEVISPEYETAVQSLGRLRRKTADGDQPRFLVVGK